MITIREQGDNLARFSSAIKALEDKAPAALNRALNHTGDKSKTAVIRALTKQTGLTRAVIVRAVKKRKPGELLYGLQSLGGNISIKYFGAREVRAGVKAKPWGMEQLYPGAFIRGGIWPKRTALPTLNGHAYRRRDTDRLPIDKVKSGLFIPEEMIEGATLDAFETTIARDLPARVGHELHRLLQANGF